MRPISLPDASFLLVEKRQTPMHVGGLHLYTLPRGVKGHEFLAELLDLLRTQEPYRPPFGEFVATGRAGPLGPLYWQEDEHFDIDYHVRHLGLPWPGRYRELFMLVSRLHGQLLDRSRPLWEMHLIEGLKGRQFALYSKLHHAAIDGVSAMHMTNAMYSTDPSARASHSPLSLENYERYKQRLLQRRGETAPSRQEVRNVLGALAEHFQTGVHLGSALRRFGGVFLGRGGDLSAPWFRIPHTSINTRVSGARRFVAQSYRLSRLQAVCKACGGTLNDVILAMCAGALRRYLISRDECPTWSLKAMAPISLRETHDLDSSNAVGFITADLATDEADPERRLRRIQASMAAGKALYQSLTPREATLFTVLTQAPTLLSSILGLGERFPAFSTVISNVPGPREQLYWNGARLDGIYPASVVFDGFALNITLVSYRNQLDFGIVACRRAVPQMQRLIDYLEEALQELEAMVGKGRPRRKATRRSQAAKPTSAGAPKKARRTAGTRQSPGAGKRASKEG